MRRPRSFSQKFPNALGRGNSFSVDPIRNVLVQNVRPTLYVMIGAVSLVLLIACANVANLLLARATGRTREIAVRAAIGGSRGRIIRQLLTESLLLSVIGGVLGLALGVVGMRALLSVNTANLPRVGDAGAFVSLDWRVVGFTMAVSIVTGRALRPAAGAADARRRRSRRRRSRKRAADPAPALRRNFARSDAGRRRSRAGVDSPHRLRAADQHGARARAASIPASMPTNVLTMRMSLSGPRFQKSEAVSLLVANGVERLKAVPGVELASATCCVPLQGGYGLPFIISGRPLTEGGPFHGGGAWMTVSPGYFEVFSIPIQRAGR